MSWLTYAYINTILWFLLKEKKNAYDKHSENKPHKGYV